MISAENCWPATLIRTPALPMDLFLMKVCPVMFLLPSGFGFFRAPYFRGSPQRRESAFSLLRKRNLRATTATRLLSNLVGGPGSARLFIFQPGRAPACSRVSKTHPVWGSTTAACQLFAYGKG